MATVRLAARPSFAKRVGKGIRDRATNWELYIMLLPALVYIIIFAYKPMYGVIIAFKDFNMRAGILGSPWCGFENFVRLFKSYWFPVILKNTLSVSLLSLVIGFPIPILFALMVNEIGHEGVKRTFQRQGQAGAANGQLRAALHLDGGHLRHDPAVSQPVHRHHQPGDSGAGDGASVLHGQPHGV